MLVNPLTAVGLVDLATSRGATGIVQTAAASAVGKMVMSYAESKGVATVNIVRREEQAAGLRKLSCGQNTLVSTDADFCDQLQRMCTKARVSVAFDPVGGDMAGTLVDVLPNKGSYIVYGNLSKASLGGISPNKLYNDGVTLEGFHLKRYLSDNFSTVGTLRLLTRVQDLFRQNVLKTDIAAKCTMDTFAEHISEYVGRMSNGKVIMCISEYVCKMYGLNTATPKLLPGGVCGADDWMPDAMTDKCLACSAPFTLFNRRHHCRVCGGLFCGGCSEVGDRWMGNYTRRCEGCKHAAEVASPAAVTPQGSQTPIDPASSPALAPVDKGSAPTPQ